MREGEKDCIFVRGGRRYSFDYWTLKLFFYYIKKNLYIYVAAPIAFFCPCSHSLVYCVAFAWQFSVLRFFFFAQQQYWCSFNNAATAISMLCCVCRIVLTIMCLFLSLTHSHAIGRRISYVAERVRAYGMKSVTVGRETMRFIIITLRTSLSLTLKASIVFNEKSI